MHIPTILIKKYPNTSWALDGEDYAGLDWRDGSPKPTEAELEELWPVVQAEIEEEKQAIIESKASAIAKLEALGLTVDEIKTAFGLES